MDLYIANMKVLYDGGYSVNTFFQSVTIFYIQHVLPYVNLLFDAMFKLYTIVIEPNLRYNIFVGDVSIVAVKESHHTSHKVNTCIAMSSVWVYVNIIALCWYSILQGVK